MSINSIANAAAARRTDVRDPTTPPRDLAEIAAAAGTAPSLAPPNNNRAGPVSTALNVLVGYIPTEIVTLYITVTGALQQPTSSGTGAATPSAGAAATAVDTVKVASSWLSPPWIAFLCFLVTTPLAVWIVYAAKIKNADPAKHLPVTFQELPLWEMAAATIAFVAWGFALPNTPFRDFAWYSPALAGIALPITSSVLGIVAPLAARKPLS